MQFEKIGQVLRPGSMSSGQALRSSDLEEMIFKLTSAYLPHTRGRLLLCFRWDSHIYANDRQEGKAHIMDQYQEDLLKEINPVFLTARSSVYRFAAFGDGTANADTRRSGWSGSQLI